MYPMEYTWIRKPTPVTTRIITALSGSSRNPQSAWKVARCPLAMWNGSPAIQVNWITSCTRFGSCQSWYAALREKTKESRTIPGQMKTMRHFSGECAWWGRPLACQSETCSTPAATATSECGCGSSFLPIRSISAAPKSGNKGISQIWSRKFTVLLPLQQIDLVRPHRFLVAEQRDQDAQPHRRLGHRVGDHEDGEDLPVDVAERVRKRDQVDVHGVQNQLDGHQDDHDVAARQHAHGSDQQQRRAQGQVMNRRNRMHRQILFLAIATEPTTATNSSREAISKGSRYSENSESASISVLPRAAETGTAPPASAMWNAPRPRYRK